MFGLVSVLIVASGPRFEDVTAAAGIPSAINAAISTEYGGPAAWVDWDGDGWTDLVVGDPAGPTRVFRNDAGTLPFIEITPPEIAAIDNVSAILPFTAAAGEGQPSPERAVLFVQTVRGVRGGEDDFDESIDARGFLHLFRLGADGALTRLPIARPVTRIEVASSGDLDGDGRMDLFLGSYICGAGSARAKTLFRLERYPLGFRLSDEDPILSGGCYPVPMLTDYHDDGRPVLLVTTDYGTLDAPTFVYSGQGQYEALPGIYGMGIATADMNDDGVLDYVMSSVGPDLTLLSDGVGADARPSRRIGALGRNTEWGEEGQRFKWGPAFADFDNDGTEELWVTAGLTGLVSGPPGIEGVGDVLFTSEPNARDALLKGGVDISDEAGLREVTAKRAVLLADFDKDGRQDGLVTGLDARFLYRNVTETEGNWIAFRFPDAPGARLSLEACGRTHLREWSGVQTVAVHESRVHFGVGACNEKVTLRVRWPWLLEKSYGPFDLGQEHEITSPGAIWVTPSQVTPGATYVVHSTLAGAVSVDGDVIVDGSVTRTAPATPGMVRLQVTWDGVRVALSPKLDVRVAPDVVLTDPWPLRVDFNGHVIATSHSMAALALEGGAMVDKGRLRPSLELMRLKVGEATSEVPAIANIRPDPTLQVEKTGNIARVRIAPLDGLGGASTGLGADEEANRGELSVVVDGESVQLFPDSEPWMAAEFAADAQELSLFIRAERVLSLKDPGRPAPEPDLSQSKIWITTPIVRADQQDIIVVVAMFRDSSGRLIQPDYTLLPTSPAAVLLDFEWRPIELGFGMSGHYVRMRTTDVVGTIPIQAGPIVVPVWSVPAEPAEVAETSTLERAGDHFVLIPRDRFGQRLGSGIATEPRFTYLGGGVYSLMSPASTLTLRVGDQLEGHFDGRTVTWSLVQSTPGAAGCSTYAAKGGEANVTAVLILWLSVWFLARSGRRRRSM
ncbi:MAG: CRTAC1 family protein [Myxococcales bacterium]|nr:CRTAC1 family protein [Myxococcales bacterium]